MSNGNIYNGNWKDGRRHGYGTQTKQNKERYEG